MRTEIRVAVIVPAGPKDDLVDTLASVLRYSDPARLIVVLDDISGSGGTFPDLRQLSPDIVVLQPPTNLPSGCFGGLWLKMAAAFDWILERYEPRLLMRLDTDALMIGEGLEELAEAEFTRDPRLGLLGSYRIGPDGGSRDFSWPARQIRAATGLRGLAHPGRRSVVGRYRRLARRQGYTDGEHVLGGAYILSNPAITAIRNNGWLTAPWPVRAMIGDDHIISMLTVAAGYRMGDFGGPDDPLALTWLGLPAHPADLLSRGKLVTHSVRSWGDLTEADIRGLFAAARAPAGNGGQQCR